MTLKTIRAFALSLPGTTEEPHFELSSFRVQGKIYCTVPPDEEHVHVFLDEKATRAAVAHDAKAFEELHWGKQLVGVRVRLRLAPKSLVLDLLEGAWRRKAPGRTVRE